MARSDNRPEGYTRVWGVSMTIAAIVLGLYFVSLFYSSVVREAARIDGSAEQAQSRP